MTWRWMSKQALLLLHDESLAEHGGSPGLRDEGLLESALARPQNLAVYGAPDHAALAASIGLAKNHAFVDGNKRIGAHVMLVFLAINGIELDYTQEELIDIILQIASGRAKAADLLEWILYHQA